MTEAPSTRPSLLVRLRDFEDRRAWHEFVDLYAPVVFGYARSRGLQNADAADLTQEVLSQVAEAIGRFDYDARRGSFRGWLFTLVRRRVSDWRARRNGRTHGTGDTAVHQQLQQQPARAEEESTAWEHEYRLGLFAWAAERVRPAVQPTTWQAFWQTAVLGHSGKAVAAALGLSVAAVYLAKNRVMARLRTEIEQLDEAGWGEGPDVSPGFSPLTPDPSPPSTGERGVKQPLIQLPRIFERFLMGKTCPQSDDWQALLDEVEPERNHVELYQHLETCVDCQQTLDGLVADPPSWAEVAQGLGPDQQAVTQEPVLRQAIERLKEQGSTAMAELETASEELLCFLRPADQPGLLGYLKDYEVQEVIGRGGMGIVLKALDPSLNRLVAIKVLPPQLASNGTARQRFVREARATAAVTHDNVIAIHAVDEVDGLPYLVMPYIAGPSLQQKLDQTGPLLVPEILRIGLQTAAGLAAAHAQGLIHRDVKPANILLENGVERVKLTDFGLARTIDAVGLSQEGVVAGTPEYMAPEQARGEPLGPRADLFSLGSVLYALCTGLPPFHGGAPLTILRKVTDETPAPIRSINPEVPDWLEAIVQRLLAKDPADRFASAADVAELLQQHLAQLQQSTAASGPVSTLSARPQQTSDSLARKKAGSLRRWLIAAAVLLVAVVSVTEATGVTDWLNAAATILRFPTSEGTLVVEVDDPQIKVDIDGQDIVLSGAGPQEIRLRAGQHRLRASKDGVSLRDEQFTISRGGKEVVRVRREAVAQTPLPAAPRKDAAPPFKLPPRPTEGKIIEQPAVVWGLPHNPACGVFSPDGKTLATGMWDGTAILWDFASGRQRAVLRTGASSSRAIAISPDSQTVATGSSDGVVRLWDVQSGELRQELTGGHHAALQAIGFAPDGKILASASWDKVRLWDLPSGKPHALVPGFRAQVWSIAYAPDGQSVTVCVGRSQPGQPGWVEVISATNGKTLRSQEFSAYVRRVAFTPDGQRLAVGYGEDGQVEIWSSMAGAKKLASFQASSKPLHALTYTPDGRRLLSAGPEGTAVLWDPEGEKPRRLATFLGHSSSIYFAAISPDGRTLATGAGYPDRTIRLWDLSALIAP